MKQSDIVHIVQQFISKQNKITLKSNKLDLLQDLFQMITLCNTKKIQNSKEGFLNISDALIMNMNSVFSHHLPFFCNFGFKISQKYTFLPYGAYYIVAFESFLSRYFVFILSVCVEVLAAGEIQCL